MAGRPKGSANVKSETIINADVLKKENKQLRSELDEIKQMLANLANAQTQTPQAQGTPLVIDESDTNDADIRQNKYIKVMSLNFGKLVLTTEARGGGKSFIFEKYGDVRNIVYADMANIIHHQQSFAEEGRFYIFDKKVVKNHGLEEYYSKILTKETIDNILEHNRNEIVTLFPSATDTQKETIINILMKKIIDGEDVDLNKIDAISRIWGVNLYDLAQEAINDKQAQEE